MRVDLRNHGHSFHSRNNELQCQVADDVWQLIDHLQLDKVILIGHSMGGKTAMKMTALQHSQRVEKLVVIDIAPVENSSVDMMMYSVVCLR